MIFADLSVLGSHGRGRSGCSGCGRCLTIVWGVDSNRRIKGCRKRGCFRKEFGIAAAKIVDEMADCTFKIWGHWGLCDIERGGKKAAAKDKGAAGSTWENLFNDLVFSSSAPLVHVSEPRETEDVQQIADNNACIEIHMAPKLLFQHLASHDSSWPYQHVQGAVSLYHVMSQQW